jgi:hypothetical protein
VLPKTFWGIASLTCPQTLFIIYNYQSSFELDLYLILFTIIPECVAVLGLLQLRRCLGDRANNTELDIHISFILVIALAGYYCHQRIVRFVE